MVVSNYAFWHMGVDTGKFDLLVLDEVHKVVDVMTSMLEVTIDPKELLEYCSKGILLEIPGLNDNVGAWIDWISYILIEEIKRIRMTMKIGIKVSVRALRTLRELKGLLDYLSKDPRNWKITDKEGYGYGNKSRKTKHTKMDKVKFSPVWPGKYLESVLYRGIPKILLVSASVTTVEVKSWT